MTDRPDNFFTKTPYTDADATPFDTAQEAWFWFILAQQARADGARCGAGMSLVRRPCEPSDILKCLDRLYRNRRIDMDHILVLRHYGRRQLAPDARRVKETRALMLWNEAFERLEPVLVRKGIIRAPDALSLCPNRFWSNAAVLYQGGLGL